MNTFEFSSIGTISSCFKEKFGIPRQPGLVTAAKATLVLNSEFEELSVRDLNGFSHIWIQFVFHATLSQGWKPMVRPPRLGGDAKVGVFASRSMFRPNPLGLSVVVLEEIEIQKSNVILHLSGCDLLDGTPVLDIKPYLPYADSIASAKGGFANQSPPLSTDEDISFKEVAQAQCQRASERLGQNLETLIRQIIQCDPRPSYQRIDYNRIYSMKLYDFDLKWQYGENNKIKVLALS